MNKNDLDNIRKNIDAVNSQLVKLLIQRMDLVDQVAAYKAANDLPVSVPERENAIIEQVSKEAGEEYAAEISAIFRAVFAASCSREERKIGKDI